MTKLDANGVYVVDGEDTARWRELQLGAVVRDQVIVESGLEVGDRVVTLGQRGLVDGDKLISSREGECCTDGRVTFASANGVAAAVEAPPKAEDAAAPEGEGGK